MILPNMREPQRVTAISCRKCGKFHPLLGTYVRGCYAFNYGDSYEALLSFNSHFYLWHYWNAYNTSSVYIGRYVQ